MDWCAIWGWIKSIGNELLTYIGGLSVAVGAIWGIAKLFGAKWVDTLFEKIAIRYKHKFDKDLASKSAQYSVLVPEQLEVVKELYPKLIDLNRSTNLLIEMLEHLEASEDSKEDDSELIDIKINVVRAEGHVVEKRVFTVDEVMLITNSIKLKKEVDEYIVQKGYLIPKEIKDILEGLLLFVEIFKILGFPKEFVQFSMQNNSDKKTITSMINTLEQMRKDNDLDNKKIIKTINDMFDLIQEQCRQLIGVEGK